MTEKYQKNDMVLGLCRGPNYRTPPGRSTYVVSKRGFQFILDYRINKPNPFLLLQQPKRKGEVQFCRIKII